MSMSSVEQQVRAALQSVEDPEAGMSVLDLGLVYGVRCAPGRVEVDLTMTSPACPAAEHIVEEAEAALRGALAAGTELAVNLVWEPPWSPERMSEEARRRFGWA